MNNVPKLPSRWGEAKLESTPYYLDFEKLKMSGKYFATRYIQTYKKGPENREGVRQLLTESDGVYRQPVKGTVRAWRLTHGGKNNPLNRAIFAIEENIINGEEPILDDYSQKLTQDYYLPSCKDFEEAVQKLKQDQKEIPIDKILDLIESKCKEAGRNLKPNWKMITERNIYDIWTKQNK